MLRPSQPHFSAFGVNRLKGAARQAFADSAVVLFEFQQHSSLFLSPKRVPVHINSFALHPPSRPLRRSCVSSEIRKRHVAPPAQHRRAQGVLVRESKEKFSLFFTGRIQLFAARTCLHAERLTPSTMQQLVVLLSASPQRPRYRQIVPTRQGLLVTAPMKGRGSF